MNQFMDRHGTGLLYVTGVQLGVAMIIVGRWADLPLAAALVLLGCLGGQIDRFVVGPIHIRLRNKGQSLSKKSR